MNSIEREIKNLYGKEFVKIIKDRKNEVKVLLCDPERILIIDKRGF